MIDNTFIINELNKNGDVVFCGEHENIYYVAVVDNWQLTDQEFIDLIYNNVGSIYPKKAIFTNQNNTLKIQYNKP